MEAEFVLNDSLPSRISTLTAYDPEDICIRQN